jgi:uracil phosphoribosyltransferase
MFVLNRENSIANQFLADLRDIQKQKDRLRFRNNLERLGEIMAYELSKSFHFESQSVQTPFEKLDIPLLAAQPVVISVLRASVPFFQGVLNFFDQAESGFIGAFRRPHSDQEDVKVELGYMAAPSIEGKTVIVVDPMLATGKSFVESVKHLLKNGHPSKIHIVSAVAAPEGVAYVKNHLNVSHQFWICALDAKLNEKAYIIPGLGDAGDLAYGPKL